MKAVRSVRLTCRGAHSNRYFQPAIDAVVTELQARHNRTDDDDAGGDPTDPRPPVIFGARHAHARKNPTRERERDRPRSARVMSGDESDESVPVSDESRITA